MGSVEPGGAPQEPSARSDRYKEYLKEKRTEANRLKQRRLRGMSLAVQYVYGAALMRLARRVQHLETLEKTVLDLQHELARANAALQHLQADNSRLDIECRRLSAQLAACIGWSAPCGSQPDHLQHVSTRPTEEKQYPRSIHHDSGGVPTFAGPIHSRPTSTTTIVTGRKKRDPQEPAPAPLSPPLSLYQPSEPIDRPCPHPPRNSGDVAHPLVGQPLYASGASSAIPGGSSFQGHPAMQHPSAFVPTSAPPTVHQPPAWDTYNALGFHSGATTLACSPSPFPPSISSASTIAMSSRPHTPASSSFGTYPPYASSGLPSYPVGPPFWPYPTDHHAFAPRLTPATSALDVGFSPSSLSFPARSPLRRRSRAASPSRVLREPPTPSRRLCHRAERRSRAGAILLATRHALQHIKRRAWSRGCRRGTRHPMPGLDDEPDRGGGGHTETAFKQAFPKHAKCASH